MFVLVSDTVRHTQGAVRISLHPLHPWICLHAFFASRRLGYIRIFCPYDLLQPTDQSSSTRTRTTVISHMPWRTSCFVDSRWLAIPNNAWKLSRTTARLLGCTVHPCWADCLWLCSSSSRSLQTRFCCCTWLTKAKQSFLPLFLRGPIAVTEYVARRHIMSNFDCKSQVFYLVQSTYGHHNWASHLPIEVASGRTRNFDWSPTMLLSYRIAISSARCCVRSIAIPNAALELQAMFDSSAPLRELYIVRGPSLMSFPCLINCLSLGSMPRLPFGRPARSSSRTNICSVRLHCQRFKSKVQETWTSFHPYVERNSWSVFKTLKIFRFFMVAVTIL